MSEVTISICTFGRPDFIKKCLTEFTLLYENSNFHPPLIVIDNNPDNTTYNRIASLIEENEYFQYVKEKKIGLCNARNKAIQECKTKYLSFVDDDAYPTGNFLNVLHETVSNEFDVAGGNEIPYSDKKMPKWYLTDNFQDKNNAVEFLSGYNIIFKVDSIKNVGGFNTNIGMKGKNIGYGDEILPQILIRRRNGVFFHNPQLLVHHYIQVYKLTRRWHLKYRFKYGRDSWKIYDKDKLVIRDIFNLFFQLLKLPNENSFYQNLKFKSYQLGRWVGAFQYLKK